MKEITTFEKALANNNQNREINSTVLYAYKLTKRAELEHLDFSDVIWDADVEPIITECKKNGLEYITISSTFSSLLCTIQLFIDAGCTLVGMTKINDIYAPEYKDDKTKPALLIKL